MTAPLFGRAMLPECRPLSRSTQSGITCSRLNFFVPGIAPQMKQPSPFAISSRKRGTLYRMMRPSPDSTESSLRRLSCIVWILSGWGISHSDRRGISYDWDQMAKSRREIGAIHGICRYIHRREDQGTRGLAWEDARE